MKKFLLSFILVLLSLGLHAQDLSQCKKVVLETDSGRIVLALYNETPQHRDNFLELERRAYFPVAVQTGDSATRHARPGEQLGSGGYETHKIPAEIKWPQFFHKKGALAAAREGNQTNPKWESSMCQFYIVTGRRFDANMLEDAEERIFRDTHKSVTFPQELQDAYFRIGGAPHLDTQYTVFGEVVEGLDVVDRIQLMPVDDFNRPLTDIHIISARVMKE